MAKEIILFSLARQGHHAVMNWICRQPKTAIYYNNCRFRNDSLDSRNQVMRFEKGSEPILVRISKIDPPRDLIIYNFINVDITKCWNYHHRLKIQNPTYCVVVRDPYNFLSSGMTYGMKGIEQKLKTWKALVRTALGKDPIPKNLSFVDINYNSWVSSEDYRRNLAQRLGIECTDISLGEQDPIGKSRVQGDEKDTSKLNVFDRWKPFHDNKNLWRNIDNTVEELGKEYFGFYINNQHEVIKWSKQTNVE